MSDKRSIFKRPQWSLASSFLAALGIFAVVTTVILVAVKKSVWVELEIVSLALAPIMFLYMLAVLYLGVKFDKKERFIIDWQWKDRPGIMDCCDLSSFDGIGFPCTEAGAEEGCLGVIIGFALDIILSIFLMFMVAFVLWLAVNALPEAIVIVFLPLFFLYRRSLRYLVARGKACKGNFGKSIAHALISSMIYSGWFYSIIYFGHYICRYLKEMR